MGPATRTVEIANAEALRRLVAAEPVLIGVRRALDALPGMTSTTILTSGPPLPWPEYTNGQRDAIVGAALYEGLARTADEADHLLGRGDLQIGGCHDLACVGSVAGVTTASMPVLVVEDRASGARGHCTLFEGTSPARLNYGVWDDEVRGNLDFLADVAGPALSELLERIPDGIPLRPIMERALRQGDELHSRNAAASLLFLREIMPRLVTEGAEADPRFVDYLCAGDYFFLRLSMAACKAMADASHGVPGSTLVTAMAFSCREFGIRVSGAGSRWFRGPLPSVEACQLRAPNQLADIEFMGGESIITEVCGLGAFAQAAAFTLQAYQGGVESMIARNLQMYDITAGEHPTFTIPYLGYRGTPVGIDVAKVTATGITPAMDVGIPGSGGGQIGAGSFRAPPEPFVEAAAFVRDHQTEGVTA